MQMSQYKCIVKPCVGENIGKYLRFLHDEDGWPDFIDSRWKDEVKDVLVKKFPEMTEDEWRVRESILFL